MPKILKNTKHYECAEELRGMFSELKPGEKIPTVAELCERTGKSHGTIVKALANLSDKSLIYKPEGRKSYVISDHLNGMKGSIAMIHSDFPSYSFLENNISQMLTQHGWLVENRIYNSRGARVPDLEELLGECQGGFFVPTSEEPSKEFIEAVRELDRPLIIMNELWHDLPFNFIAVDNYAVGQLAIKHLAQLGHRKTLLLFDQPHCPSAQQRLKGAIDASEELGDKIKLDVMDVNLQSFEVSRSVSYEHFKDHLNNNGLAHTAVFATSFEGALAVMRACREHGLTLPRDLSLVCWEGESDFGEYVIPQLTTLKVDLENYALRATALMEDLLGKKGQHPRQELMKPFLNFRESCIEYSPNGTNLQTEWSVA